MQTYLNSTRVNRVKPELFSFLEHQPERLTVVEVREQVSRREPLVQLADLFAGMARTSLEQSSDLARWRAGIGQPGQLFDELLDDAVSRGRRAKFEIIDATKTECERYKLGVSLKTKGYLCTPKPSGRIDFWLWEPQGAYDKAPTNRGR